MSNAQEQIIKFTVQELERMLREVKEGKTPQMSSSISKLTNTLSNHQTSMTEEEVNNLAERLVHEIIKPTK